MLRSALKAFLILSPICSAISAKADYSPNFGGGSLPAGVTTARRSSAKPLMDFYRRGYTEEGWTVNRIGGNGYVVMAPTHTGSEVPVRSILTLPAQEMAETTWLSWEALSLLPDFPEAYHVLVQPEGGDAAEVFTTDAESSDWTLRMVSLAQFAGQKCNVIFECTSVNRYMLMLSGINIYNPADRKFSLTDTTPAFGDMKGTEVCGTLLNTGAPLAGASLLCLLADGSEAGRLSLGENCATGAVTEFSFLCPGELNASTSYSLVVEDAQGERAAVGEGSFYTSHFARTLLVDKATGMWCNNCPAGNVLLDGLEQRFGRQLAVVETHVSNGDRLENTAYWNSLGFHSVPSFKLNRIAATAGSNISQFADYYNEPTIFGLDFSLIKVAESGNSVEAEVTALAAEDLDNSTGRYSIGYVLTATFHDDRYYQRNSCNSPSDQRYYYLPVDIPGELLYFHNVSLTSGEFAGLSGSLPAAVRADEEMKFTFSVDRPELLDNLREGTLVAYVLDTETGRVLNAASCPLAQDIDTGSVDSVTAQPALLAPAGRSSLRISAPGAWTLRCLDMAGRLCFSARGSGEATVAAQLPAGAYVARLDSECGADRLKFIIK